MSGVVVIDTNLMVLLIVGSASKEYISRHKRLGGYTVDDFEMLGVLLSGFSEIVLLPHILAEVSNISRQAGNLLDGLARAKIRSALRTIIETCVELPLQSMSGVQRDEFDMFGLTDSVILHFCTMAINGIRPTLLTVDTELANSAYSSGYSVIDYKEQFQSR
jgi:hypothetical protein